MPGSIFVDDGHIVIATGGLAVASAPCPHLMCGDSLDRSASWQREVRQKGGHQRAPSGLYASRKISHKGGAARTLFAERSCLDADQRHSKVSFRREEQALTKRLQVIGHRDTSAQHALCRLPEPVGKWIRDRYRRRADGNKMPASARTSLAKLRPLSGAENSLPRLSQRNRHPAQIEIGDQSDLSAL